MFDNIILISKTNTPAIFNALQEVSNVVKKHQEVFFHVDDLRLDVFGASLFTDKWVGKDLNPLRIMESISLFNSMLKKYEAEKMYIFVESYGKYNKKILATTSNENEIITRCKNLCVTLSKEIVESNINSTFKKIRESKV